MTPPSSDSSVQRLVRALMFLTALSFILTAFILHTSLNRMEPTPTYDMGVPLLMSTDQDSMGSSSKKRRVTSDPYLKLKDDFEHMFPPSDRNRIHDYVKGLRKNVYKTQLGMPYDIHNCPPDPPKGYPMAWNIMDVLKNWNPDDTSLPNERIHQGLCIFDWTKDVETAQRYREAEVPFIIQNNPDLWQTSERWNRNEGQYLFQLLRNQEYKTEYSKNNHMMYWKVRSQALPKDWTEPTEIMKLSYGEWLEKAESLESTTDHATQEHWYFRINANYKGKDGFMYNELPIFNPTTPSFFMVDSKQQRGINCRFGMKGIIAETHYDQSRNFIVLLGGERRYILAHPSQCRNMVLYPKDHPSGRHSAVNWSHPNLQQHPQFAKAQVNEVVLQAGDALYLPTFWFHFIVSLNINYQCNARSGTTFEYKHEIHKCGFI